MTLTRRDALALGAGAAAVAAMPLQAWAEDNGLAAAIAEFTGGADVTEGGVEIGAPEIAENGNETMQEWLTLIADLEAQEEELQASGSEIAEASRHLLEKITAFAAMLDQQQRPTGLDLEYCMHYKTIQTLIQNVYFFTKNTSVTLFNINLKLYKS